MIKPLRPRFNYLVTQADAARDARQFDRAAILYEEAAKLRRTHAGVLIQAGHMRKEMGSLVEAERHYLAAQRLRPDDADLALQLGHFFKVSGRIDEATEAYRRALQLKPDDRTPLDELAGIEALRDRFPGTSLRPLDDPAVASPDDLQGRTAAELGVLVPKLAPRPYAKLLFRHHDHIEVSRLGRREEGYWGKRRTLRGVEAVRGFCIAEVPILAFEVLVNGIAVHQGPMAGGYALVFEEEKERIRKYVYHAWVDFAGFAPGLHSIELRFHDADEGSRSFHDDVVIAAPLAEADYPNSDGLVEIDRDDPRPLVQQIRTRPSMVRQAKRALFPEGVRNVLVMRTDQLGDMVASLPAMLRLRALLPGARIVGMLTPANAELARTLNVFDEIIVIDFPDDRLERRRLMPLDTQAALRQRLLPYQFDIAVDLAQANVSRDLLLLSGAKFLYGTGGEDWPWLSSDFIFNTHDRWTKHDNTPHSTKVLALVEGLGTLLATHAPIIRRPDLDRAALAKYGISPDEPFAVVHLGARIGFSRWPHYVRLIDLLLARTRLKIVAMTEDPLIRDTIPDGLMANDRVVFMDQRLPFDDFDAFISFATVMAGNDSGPKHLASLRGTKVVTIFSSRINWSEWGQENVGVIISRRLPCAGCAILHEPEECGIGFACIKDIRAEEVFEAMLAYVPEARRTGVEDFAA